MTAPMGNNGAKRYSYCYDREGRQVGMDVDVVSVTSSPTLTAGTSGNDTRFYYDNSRNRVKLITKSGDAYYFVYDPTASIPAVVYEAVNTTTYLNVREPSGALISREKYEDGDLVYSRTYHFDGLGSTIALTDEDGVTTDTYSYDAWGNVTSHIDPDPNDGIGLTTDNPYQYVGEVGYYTHYQEPTLKLLQLGVRYYDPSTGGFTQRDPVVLVMYSPYSYALQNPLMYTDTTGKYPTVNCGRRDQTRRVNAALRKICDNIARCFPFTTGPRQQAALRDFCNRGHVQCGSRFCVRNPGACGHTDGSNRPGKPGVGKPFIYICLPGFTSACDTGTGNPRG